MKRWYDNWDVITPIFKFSPDVGKVIYTTNAIESLNSTYRKLNRQRSVFPSDTALLKALYLATFEATKKWIEFKNYRNSTSHIYSELTAENVFKSALEFPPYVKYLLKRLKEHNQ